MQTSIKVITDVTPCTLGFLQITEECFGKTEIARVTFPEVDKRCGVDGDDDVRGQIVC